MALTDQGDLYTWGNGDHGKLGHGDTLKVALPQLLHALKGPLRTVTAVASYNEHTSALVSVGTDGGAPPCELVSS